MPGGAFVKKLNIAGSTNLVQDWVALMSKPIALFKKKIISSVRLKFISSLG